MRNWVWCNKGKSQQSLNLVQESVKYFHHKERRYLCHAFKFSSVNICILIFFCLFIQVKKFAIFCLINFLSHCNLSYFPCSSEIFHSNYSFVQFSYLYTCNLNNETDAHKYWDKIYELFSDPLGPSSVYRKQYTRGPKWVGVKSFSGQGFKLFSLMVHR